MIYDKLDTIEKLKNQYGEILNWTKFGDENILSNFPSYTLSILNNQYKVDQNWDGNIAKYSDVGKVRFLSSQINIPVDNLTEIQKTQKNITDISKIQYQNKTIQTLCSESALTISSTYVFGSCQNLRDVYLPNVYMVSSANFSACKSLETIYMPSLSSTSDRTFFSSKKLANADVRSLQFVKDYDFFQCNALSNINCSNVMSVGFQGFSNCYCLSSINTENIDYLKACAFENCSSMISINLQNMTYIPDNAFAKCTNLRSINESPHLSSIGKRAFENCSLLSIRLDLDNIAFFGDNALKSTNLIDVPSEINNDVATYVGTNWFSLNDVIQDVRFSQVSAIGTSFCNQARKIRSAYLPKIKEINSNAFHYCGNGTPKGTTCLLSIIMDMDYTGINRGYPKLNSTAMLGNTNLSIFMRQQTIDNILRDVHSEEGIVTNWDPLVSRLHAI